MNTNQPHPTDNNKGTLSASTQESTKKEPAVVTGQQHAGKNTKPNNGQNKKGTQKITTPTTGTTTRKGSLLAIFALLVALASLFASYTLWQQSEETRQELARQSENNKLTFNKILPGISTFKSDLSALEKDLSSKFEQELKTIQENTERMYAQSERGQDSDWILAEAEYLLRIASHRLQFEHDIKSASLALDLADKRLQTLAHPALTPVRRQISDEISRLKATNLPDITGMALMLGSLQETVGQLPLIQAIHLNESADTTSETSPNTNHAQWKVLLNEVWSALKGLVTIRRTDTSGAALLPPEEHTFLVHNLQLKLESARLALFRTEDASYHDSLKTARNWINTYFDASAPVTKNLLNSISELDAVNLDTPLPDISGSLTAIRELINRNTTIDHVNPPQAEGIVPQETNQGIQP